jgi:hypothetical protein
LLLGYIKPTLTKAGWVYTAFNKVEELGDRSKEEEDSDWPDRLNIGFNKTTSA